MLFPSSREESVTNNRGYIREIDALRAFSVFLVMAHHWGRSLTEGLELGSAGVRMFFVISGFLITGIILEARQRIATDQSSIGRELKTFYVRRTLRIFPVYYAVIFAAFAIGQPAIRSAFPWLVTYLGNVYFAVRGSWDDPATHLWSLAVEEQFYLVWPLTVLLVPRRALLPLFVAVITFGPFFRILLEVGGANQIAVRALTPSSADALGLGALLALAKQQAWNTRKWSLPCLTVGVPLIFVPSDTAMYLGMALTGFAILNLVVVHRGTAQLAWSRWRPLTYLGTISYGLYLFHPFAALGVGAVFRHFGGAPRPLVVACYFVATIAAAAASWHFFEGPINGLKRHFPYRGKPSKLSNEAPAAVL
jgi:peptidoglycan/LPS O-acetylase OafA/YrhL